MKVYSLLLAIVFCWPTSIFSQVQFLRHTITTSADNPRSVYAADVDGDGDMDVLSASADDNRIAWYENDGNEYFTAHTITTNVDNGESVYAVDVDGDGDMDVLSASHFDSRIAWYENDGNENFSAHTITTNASGARTVYAVDVDGDGDIDVLSASSWDDKIAWYENDGSQGFTPHTITTNAVWAWSVYATDLDGDEDIDVLSASNNDDKVAWYENDGSENFTPHIITTSADWANSVYAVDVDSDGDMDVLSASFGSGEITWYANDGSQRFTAHTINTYPVVALWVHAGDIDGDGDIDVISNDDAWYENDGIGNFIRHSVSIAGPISDLEPLPRTGYAVDVDGDGDLDVISGAEGDDRIAWYENLRIPSILSAENLSSCDWQNPGDGLVIFDQSTGLEWLSLTVTKGNSILDTEALPFFDDLGLNGKFRWATNSEIAHIMNHLSWLSVSEFDIGSVVWHEHLTTSQGDETIEWIQLFGQTGEIPYTPGGGVVGLERFTQGISRAVVTSDGFGFSYVLRYEDISNSFRNSFDSPFFGYAVNSGSDGTTLDCRRSVTGSWLVREELSDGSLDSGSGYEDRVTDDVYGDQAAVFVPGSVFPSTYPTEPIDVSIHVFDEPLPIPGVAAAGTKFMHIELVPQPPSPLPPMGLSVKIPLLEPMVEFSSHYSIQPECGPRYLDLQRVDPVTGELVPAQMWGQRCVRDPCSAAYPWNYEAFLYPRVRCMPASPWVPCPPGIPSYCGSCGSTALCHYVATFSTVVGVLPEDFPVIIDIKPGGFPNSINTKSKGVIPVAILGDETFDFALIDLATLSFGPGGATPYHGIHPEDVNGDGITDLVLHFSTRETGLAVGDTEACIAGQTFDFGSGNLPITGCDSVRTIR